MSPLRTQHNKHTSDTMKQERKTTLVRTFVRIYCDITENERNARRHYNDSLRIIRPQHAYNMILTN